jgi:metal-dependent hydrolase (beta-lactamase superfamily II)
MLQKITGFFGRHVDMLIGGLHLMDKEKRFTEYIIQEMPVRVKKAAPGHCTGSEAAARLRAIYKENFIELKAGMELEI